MSFLLGGSSNSQQSAPTSQTITQTNIPAYAQPYVENMLGATQQQLFNLGTNAVGYDSSGNPIYNVTGIKGYTPFGSNTTGTGAAGQFNPTTGQYDFSQTNANGSYMAGMGPGEMQAAQAAVAGYTPLQQQAQQGIAGLQPSTATNAGINTAMGLQGSSFANPGTAQQYMNPYIQASLAPQLQLANQQYGIAGQQQQGAATQAGAFGGSRSALANALNQQNQMLAQNQIISSGLNTGYQQAQQQYNTEQQAQQSLANLLGNLGQTQYGQQTGIYGLQAQTGAQQQAQQQQVINQAIQNYANTIQYPQQQLAFMNSQLRGLPLSATNATSYQAPPSITSQIAGLGATAYGLSNLSSGKKEGGAIKMASGGIASLNEKVLAHPEEFSLDTLKRGVQDGAISDFIGIPTMAGKEAEAQRMKAMQGAAQAQQPPIAQQVMNAAGPQGVPGLRSNIGAAMADGGIVAFADNPNQPVQEGMPATDDTPDPYTRAIRNIPSMVYDTSGVPPEQTVPFLGKVPGAAVVSSSPAAFGPFGYTGVESNLADPLQAQAAAARSALQNWTGRQRAADPQGYQSALSAYNQAQQALANRSAAPPSAPAPAPAAPPVAPSAGIGAGATTQQRLPAAPGGITGLPSGNMAMPPAPTVQAPTLVNPNTGTVSDATKAIQNEALERQEDLDTGRKAAIAEAQKGITGLAYEDYKKRLEEEAKRFGADREQAKNMAILKAGLAIMGGTSPYAFANIGKGAMAGVEDYEAAAKDIHQAERENRKEMSLIEQARRAEKIGDVNREIDRINKTYDAKEARIDKYADALVAATGMDRKEALAVAQTNFKTRSDYDLKNLEVAAQYGIAGVSANSHLRAAEISAAAHILGANITAGAHVLGANIAAGARDEAQVLQRARLIETEMKNLPLADFRTSYARSQKMESKNIPAPGKDLNFDAAVQRAYQQELGNRVNSMMAMARGTAAPAAPAAPQQNPYAGYSMVQP